ncbi:NHP2, NOLA2, H/ACA ribonucleoprotein complex subunit 2 [Babesia microti strain RI]|uniref:NHP2, NOLA2, H/ACA ribonucleoprotein complex subunit 2 n=1 Tax=Babesia microti (strain RI) TaxID=1133968 RepID=I7IGB8_BABMR|nr:NHP2, NOLA2, H/ACA ribonucleoprotein complex subunit 2 [Babesia microti strain RI]CCF73586.1 NHP2, NOLA2, H/ACA ribonucleoprotein complex subunit 2 [Babesia microti strain RI]|eukprot:XP_012648195.1 NHP2, NOLA2, H/ACA ribonucleoprotein complex subunit 2 [Babesia microti strain RI]
MDCDSEYDDPVSDIDENYEFNPDKEYISPIATPLLLGKARIKALQLVQKAIALENFAKQQFKTNLSSGATVNVDLALCRCIKRGVIDVTKAVRKNIKGLVLIASDVYPVDVVAHLPILCEEKNLTYAYLPCKKILAATCRSKRPVCVVLVVEPPDNFQKLMSQLTNAEHLDYSKIFEKVDSAIRKGHPYL